MRDFNGGHLVVGLALGGSLAFGLALPSLVSGTAEASCAPGQTLQGDTDIDGYDWFYCEPDVPACEFEDSPGPCFWDATARGNGSGLSFTVNADQTLTYQG